jgi:hypothetical protein
MKELRSMDEYEIPTTVQRRASELVKSFDNAQVGICPFFGIVNMIRDRKGCRALEQEVCYAVAPTKTFEKVESFTDCPIYKFLEQRKPQATSEVAENPRSRYVF